MSSLTYWENRQARRMFEYMESAEQTADEISKLYLKSSRYISLELDEIFERFQTRHKLSEPEAYRLLNSLHDKTSLDELKAALKSGKGGMTKAEILAELESPAYQARLERLQQLQNQIDLTMNQIYGQEKATNTSHYVDLANEAYYKSIFDIQQRTGLGFGFNAIDSKAIDQVINSKWSGENYSKRIWKNTNALSRDLKEELLLSLVTGRTDRETADIIANKFAQGASNARRLVRTESCNLANQMEMQSYKECGIEAYIFVATLDLKTSSACRELDRKRFPVSKQQPGVNCPPMHPWCRSTTICDISDTELAQMKRRARDPVTGKTNMVPADTSYKEWHSKNVAGKPEAESEEKKLKNFASDRKQYNRYRQQLGDKYIPDSVTGFQNIKYNNKNEYGILKAQSKGMTYYNKAVNKEPGITEYLKNTADQCGMEVAGIEYRIKDKDSYLSKIRRKFTPEGNQYEIKDILRYTYTASTDTLAAKTLNAIDMHGKAGYNTVEVKNYWLDKNNPYNGINTILRTPDGQAFELQYHTPESFDVKNGAMHQLYEKQRLIQDESSIEYMDLNDKMFDLSDSMKIPTGIEEVIGYD